MNRSFPGPYAKSIGKPTWFIFCPNFSMSFSLPEMSKWDFLLRKIRSKEVTVKLQTTKLCVNCESIYQGNSPCPYCRSEIFLWLFRVLGTALGSNAEENIDQTFVFKEGAAFRSHLHPSVPRKMSSGDAIMRSGSFAEFRTGLSRLGREMVRFLTFGMIHAYK